MLITNDRMEGEEGRLFIDDMEYMVGVDVIPAKDIDAIVVVPFFRYIVPVGEELPLAKMHNTFEIEVTELP